MKNIKDKIFAILAAAVILIGTGAGSGIVSNSDIPDIPGIEDSELPPKDSDGGDASTNGDPDEEIDLGI